MHRPTSVVAAALLAVGCGQSLPSGGPDGLAPLDAVMGAADGGAGDAQASGWGAIAPLAQGPRQECAVVAVAGKIFVIGGFNANLETVATVEAYDPKSDSWVAVASMPEKLHHVNAAVVGGKIYALGANRGLNFAPSGTSYVYDPTLDTWSPLAPLPAGTERGAAAVAVIGSSVYLAGGLGGNSPGSVAHFARYETSSNLWTVLPDLPEPRDHLVGGAHGGVFFAIGGRNGGIGALRGRVDAFDPTSGQWTVRAPMLTPRGGAAVAGLPDGRLFVLGGEGNPDKPSGVFAQNEVYDPTLDRWTALAPMLTPRHGTGAATLDGTIYVPAGATVQAFGATAICERFTP